MTLPPPFLFDLDGTLAHTLPDIAASTNHVRALHGVPPASAALVSTFVGDGARTLVSRALAEVLPPDGPARTAAIERAYEDYVAHHRTQVTALAHLFPGVREHLTLLRERGHALGVVTNKPAMFAVPLLQHLGIAAFFGIVVGGDTLPQKKPDPAPLLHALRALGADAVATGAQATMVGDSLQDLRAGKAAGLRTIACLFGYGEPGALRREGADAFWRAFGGAE